jgi:hypothetical protein
LSDFLLNFYYFWWKKGQLKIVNYYFIIFGSQKKPPRIIKIIFYYFCGFSAAKNKENLFLVGKTVENNLIVGAFLAIKTSYFL